MEEESQQLDEVISDVIVRLLQAQDARREKGFVLVQSYFINTVPGEESELEKVFHQHHHLERSRVASHSIKT